MVMAVIGMLDVYQCAVNSTLIISTPEKCVAHAMVALQVKELAQMELGQMELDQMELAQMELGQKELAATLEEIPKEIRKPQQMRMECLSSLKLKTVQLPLLVHLSPMHAEK